MAESALAAARADVARAHTQSLINAAALAFVTGALNASTAAALPGGRAMNPATLSALLGSAVGALALLATIWLTQHYQNPIQRCVRAAGSS
jgi:uncharacterized membrane protein